MDARRKANKEVMVPFDNGGDVLLPSDRDSTTRMRAAIWQWQLLLGKLDHRFKVRWSQRQAKPYVLVGVETVVLSTSSWLKMDVQERWRTLGVAVTRTLYRKSRALRAEAMARIGFLPEGYKYD